MGFFVCFLVVIFFLLPTKNLSEKVSRSHNYYKLKLANGREISGRKWESFPVGKALRLQGDHCRCSLTCLALAELLSSGAAILSNGMERLSWSAGSSWHSFSKHGGGSEQCSISAFCCLCCSQSSCSH